MARKDKAVKLKVVEDSNSESDAAIRLDGPDGRGGLRGPQVARAEPGKEPDEVSRRLDLPDRDEVELRTHQPGIEALMDGGVVVQESLEEHWADAATQRRPIPWGWFALIGLVICGTMVWSLTRIKGADKQIFQARADAESAMVNQVQEEMEARQLIERIESVIRGFFSATSVDQLVPLVRQPERVVPLMRRYYEGKPVAAAGLDQIKKLRGVTLENRADFWMASVALGDGTSKSMVLEVGPDGVPHVDWESMVCYQPMPWDDYVSQRPAGSVLDFRVYVEKDDFYSHEFVDEKKWVSFRLTALKSIRPLFGYVRAESDMAAQLQREIDAGGGKVSMILRLDLPEGLESPAGVVIEKILSSRWIYIKAPDSGS